MRFRTSTFGSEMSNTEVVPKLLRLWIRHAARGDIILPNAHAGIDFPMAGQSVVIVGDEDAGQEYAAAVVNDLLRQPAFHDNYAANESLSPNWLSWHTAGEVHQIYRSDAHSTIVQPMLMVVTDVMTEDKWSCRTLATLLAMRQRMSKPTIVVLSWSAHTALYPDNEGIGSVDPGLSEILGRQLRVVL